MRCFGHLLIRAHSQPASTFPHAKAGMMPVKTQTCIFLNVGLGEAAKRDVGTGANQIPDMSKWKSLKAPMGWRETPDGFIEQWGKSTYGNGDADFVIPFPHECFYVVISSDPNDTQYAEIAQAFPVSTTKFRTGCATANGGDVSPATLTCNWKALGW